MTLGCSSLRQHDPIAGVDQAATVVVAPMTSFVVPDSCLLCDDDCCESLGVAVVGSGVDDRAGELRRDGRCCCCCCWCLDRWLEGTIATWSLRRTRRESVVEFVIVAFW